MNVLLVIPKTSVVVFEWPTPPVGIGYVSASLKKAGFNVFTLNLYFSDNVFESIRETMIQNNISAVGCGDLVVQYQAVKEVIDIAKEVNPEVVTFIGGGFVTYSPIEAMKLIPNADYGVIGEGEITTREFIDALSGGKDCVRHVDGLVYRDQDEIKMTSPRAEMADLDEIPYPDYEGFRVFEIQNQWAAITTSRSCPFSCTFCSHSGGKKYRQRSLDSIFSELDMLISKYEIKGIFLNDELFAANRGRLEEFCARIKRYNIKWFVYLRISKYITDDLLQLMKDAGCTDIFYGLESADDRILKSMRKGTTVAEMERVLLATKKSGIYARGNFIFGDVEETPETVNNTLKWIEDVGKNLLHNYDITMIRLYPGAPLYDYAVRNGYITDTVKHIEMGCPEVNISKLTDREYYELSKHTIPAFRRTSEGSNISLIISPNTDEYCYDIDWRCPHCSCDNKIIIEAGVLFRLNPFICGACGFETQGICANDYIKLIDKRLDRLLKEHNCVYWGAGATWTMLSKYSDAIRNNASRLIVVDSNYEKLQEGFWQVHSPDIIQQNPNIDTIICTPSIYHDIKSRIGRAHPEITIIGLHELGLIEDLFDTGSEPDLTNHAPK